MQRQVCIAFSGALKSTSTDALLSTPYLNVFVKRRTAMLALNPLDLLEQEGIWKYNQSESN